MDEAGIKARSYELLHRSYNTNGATREEVVSKDILCALIIAGNTTYSNEEIVMKALALTDRLYERLAARGI